MNYKVLVFLLVGLLLFLSRPAAATHSSANAPKAKIPPTQDAAELLSSGRADEAIAILRSHLQMKPNDAAAQALMMRAFFATQQWDEAIAAGQQAIALAPNSSPYHLWLGRSYGEKADHSVWMVAVAFAKKTRAEFEKAVELDGSNVDARTDLAEFYVEAPSFLGGSKEKAAAQADKVRALGHEPASLWIRAKIAESEKDYSAAEQHLRAAIQASHDDPDTFLNLGSFYRRRGRLPEMEKAVDQAVKVANHSEDSSVLLEAAELLYKAGRNFEGAVQMVRNYIASPQHSEDAPLFEAYYLLGAILEKLGDRRAAAEQYQAALSLASGFEPALSALKHIH